MLTTRTKAYIAAATVAGLAAGFAALLNWELRDASKLLAYLVLTLIASAVKARIPGITGSVSLGFIGVLTGVAVMSLPETVLAVTVAAIAQTLWRAGQRPRPVQVLFSVSVLVASTWLAHTVAGVVAPASPTLRVLAAVVPLYLLNVGAVAGLLSLLSSGNLNAIWEKFQLAVFPCYLAGAFVAVLLAESNMVHAGWTPVLSGAGLAYLMFNSYRSWLRRLA